MLEIRIGYLGSVLSGGGTGFKPCLWAVKTFKNALFEHPPRPSICQFSLPLPEQPRCELTRKCDSSMYIPRGLKKIFAISTTEK